jgi:hypothetical protein
MAWLGRALIRVSFAKQGETETVFQYLVVNASNSEPLGLYESTAETGNNNVCFSPGRFPVCYRQGQQVELGHRSDPLTVLAATWVPAADLTRMSAKQGTGPLIRGGNIGSGGMTRTFEGLNPYSTLPFRRQGESR